MNFEDKIYAFTDEHPFLAWILARLVICICACTIAAMGFFALIAIYAPFVLIAEEDAGWGAFAAWLWLPLIATVIWLMCSIIGYVWKELIE